MCGMTWFRQKYKFECSSSANGVYSSTFDFENHCFNGPRNWYHDLLGTFIKNLYEDNSEVNDNDNQGMGVARAQSR